MLSCNRRHGLLVMLWIMLSSAACNLSRFAPPANTPQAAAEFTQEVPLQTIGPENYPENVNPLTGMEVENEAQLRRLPIIVKISNSPALVRPQSGIGAADLVYEHYTEVGVTRFSAIFYTNAPRRVGSIRSARLIDYELAPMYQGLLVFSGASIGVDKRIYGSESVINQLCSGREDREQCEKEADIIGPPGLIPPSDFVERAYKGVLFGRPYFWRDEAIPVPHNMFADLAAIWERAAEQGQTQQPSFTGMAFQADTPPGDSAPSVEVRYRTTLVRWQYDDQSGRYLRFSDNRAHFDANTEQQVSAANVVILYAGHYLTDIIESQSGDTIHWSAQITLWPEGDAVLLRDGKRYAGRWLRPTRPDLLRLETPTGEPLYLKPGNTWFQIMPLPEQMDSTVEWVKFE